MMPRHLLLRVNAVFCIALMTSSETFAEPPQKNEARTYRGISPADPRVLNHQAACPPTCPADCKDIQDLGNGLDGLYAVYLSTDDYRPLLVQCELETNGGGWLIFQRRADGSENFYRNWTEYENGFGDSVRAPEFWLGLKDLHLLLAQKRYRLRVDLTNFTSATAYEEYQYFSISSAVTKYSIGLMVGGHSGTAGDSMSHVNGMQFSTIDQDNDLWSGHCARDNCRGAWWYAQCTSANLNGVYNNNSTSTTNTNVHWNTWSSTRPLKTTEMKFRPM